MLFVISTIILQHFNFPTKVAIFAWHSAFNYFGHSINHEPFSFIMRGGFNLRWNSIGTVAVEEKDGASMSKGEPKFILGYLK